MKKIISLLLVLTLSLCATVACSEKTVQSLTIAVPNDTTNEARALLLLEANGILKLKEGAGMTATKLDIVENPFNVTIVEIEAAQLPAMRQDVDFAVINSNFAAGAGLNPGKDALLREGAEYPQYPVDETYRIAVPVEEVAASYAALFGSATVFIAAFLGVLFCLGSN